MISKTQEKIETVLHMSILVVGLIGVALFMLAFIYGAVTVGDGGRQNPCEEINKNIERLYPVKWGCWAWKDVK